MSNESKYRGKYQESFTQASTAVAFSRVIGWVPKKVKVDNVTSYSFIEWAEGMAAANGLLTTAATGARTKVTSDGITVGTVTDSITGKVGKGFTVGLDTTINIASEKLFIEAE